MTLSVDSPALRPSTLSLRTTSADAGPSTSRDHLDRLFVYPQKMSSKCPLFPTSRRPTDGAGSRFLLSTPGSTTSQPTRKPYPSACRKLAPNSWHCTFPVLDYDSIDLSTKKPSNFSHLPVHIPLATLTSKTSTFSTSSNADGSEFLTEKHAPLAAPLDQR
uniref:(northern house mosquito) hypothetical protein n=1 Tax=Culex pipiens TaxID=7175 RepID=A0A8D8CAI3_CULPI